MGLHQLLLIGIVASFGVVGCDTDEGPAEEMGEALDETGENMQEAGEDAGDAVEDACEEAREGVDADDRDC